MRKRKYKINEEFLDAIDTPEKAYFLGWAYSDGYHNEKTYSFRLALQARDEDILIKLNSILESECPIKFVKRRKEHHQDQKYLDFHSKKLSKSLSNLGVVQNKSKTLIIPLDKIPEKYTKYLLRGWFEGDGHVSFRDKGRGTKLLSFNIVSASETCAKQLKLLIESHSGEEIRVFKYNEYWRLMFNSYRNIYRFLLWLYDGRPDLTLNRKKKTFDDLVSFYGERYNNGKDRKNQKMTDSSLSMIEDLRKQNFTVKQISEKVKITQSAVFNRLKGKKYYSSKVKKYSINHEKLSLDQISNEKAYLFGYLVSKCSIDPITTNVCISDTDESKLLFLKNILENTRSLSLIGGQYRLNFAGKSVIESLRKIGINGRKQNFNFPFELLTNKQKKFFILGLLESRGNLFKRKDRKEITLSFSIPNIDLSKKIQEFIFVETGIEIRAKSYQSVCELRKSGLGKPLTILTFLLEEINGFDDLSFVKKFKQIIATLPDIHAGHFDTT